MSTCVCIQTFALSANITCFIRWSITHWCSLYLYISSYDMCCPCQYTTIIVVVWLLLIQILPLQHHDWRPRPPLSYRYSWPYVFKLEKQRLSTRLFKWTPNGGICEVLSLMKSDNLDVRISSVPAKGVSSMNATTSPKSTSLNFFESLLLAVCWRQINIIWLDSSCDTYHLGKSCPQSVVFHRDSYLPAVSNIYVLFYQDESTEQDVTDLFHYQRNHYRRSRLSFQQLVNERNDITLQINNFTSR